MIRKIFVLTALVLSTNSLAEKNIKILALFQDKAIVVIDGNQQKIEVGKPIGDVTLVSANSKQAVIKINGETRILKLGSGTLTFKSDIADPAQKSAVIFKNEAGMFLTQAIINGNHPVEAVIDTGAIAVAISRRMADEMHLDYGSGKQFSVSTANGAVNTHYVNLASVKVGQIELENVPALINDGEMNIVLLGMTFLNRLKMTHGGDRLTLKK